MVKEGTIQPVKYLTKDLVNKVKYLKIIYTLTRSVSLLEKKEDYEKYDPLSIAIKIFDTVIENMGFSGGISKEDLILEVAPMLKAIDEIEHIVRDDNFYEDYLIEIIGRLLNYDQSGSFSKEYRDYSHSEEDYPLRKFSFKLLSERLSEEGIVLLRAETEGINIFLKVLDIDIQNHQKALMYLMELHLADGKVEKTIELARDHKRSTTFYAQSILDQMEQTRRDISLVDWGKSMPDTLNNAFRHLTNVIEQHRTLILNIEEMRSKVDPLTPPSELKDYHQLLQILRDSLNDQLELQAIIMDARRTFREEQDKQIFRLRRIREGLNLQAEVFDPVLKGTRLMYEAFLEAFIPQISGLKENKLFSLNELIGRLLKKTSQKLIIKKPILITKIRKIEYKPINYFPKELREEVHGFLASTVPSHPNILLSELLEKALDQGRSELFLEYLKFFVLGAFVYTNSESQFSNKYQVTRTKLDFRNTIYAGRDFRICLKEGV
ncbi:MAG: hypothetical protein ACTSQI_12350 [Candidatus Helarchaeota archaeon]